MRKDKLYCDNCGEELLTIAHEHWYSEIPWVIDSANAGESAVICKTCNYKLRNANLITL